MTDILLGYLALELLTNDKKELGALLMGILEVSKNIWWLNIYNYTLAAHITYQEVIYPSAGHGFPRRKGFNNAILAQCEGLAGWLPGKGLSKCEFPQCNFSTMFSFTVSERYGH